MPICNTGASRRPRPLRRKIPKRRLCCDGGCKTRILHQRPLLRRYRRLCNLKIAGQLQGAARNFSLALGGGSTTFAGTKMTKSRINNSHEVDTLIFHDIGDMHPGLDDVSLRELPLWYHRSLTSFAIRLCKLAPFPASTQISHNLACTHCLLKVSWSIYRAWGDTVSDCHRLGEHCRVRSRQEAPLSKNWTSNKIFQQRARHHFSLGLGWQLDPD